jgi:hypothetical protein
MVVIPRPWLVIAKELLKVFTQIKVYRVQKLTLRYLDFHGQVKPALTPMKTMLERFANGTSSEDFFDALNQIYRDADKDEELRQWFKNVDSYIRRCLREQGYIIQPIANDDFNTLYDHGRYLLREKYRTHTDRVLDEIKFFGKQFDEDEQNRAFADSVQKLFHDLGQDEGGKTTFKPHLLKDVTEVILPRVLETIHYIPIPRLEYADPKVDFIIENLIVESDNLAPNVLEFRYDISIYLELRLTCEAPTTTGNGAVRLSKTQTRIK